MRSTKRIVQIASIPERVDSLKVTIESLLPQVDGIAVMLNIYDDIPAFLMGNKKISTVMLDNSMTDAAKFYNIENREGYIFTCDDDLCYPSTYISDMIDAIDKYKCIISLHGKAYPRPFKDFYHIERNYRCLGNCLSGGYVDVGGSGVMGWHSDFFKLKYSDFPLPNMSDVFVSKAAKEQGVKIYVIPHSENYLKHTRYTENLFCQENKKGFAEQTRILKEMFNGN